MSKIIDTKAYVSVLREAVEAGEEAGMRIAGSSMAPFLVDRRDDIFFHRPDGPLKKGDMVFYQRRSGQFVMHRICKVRPEGFYLVGDAQTEVEGPILREQIFARITQVRRKGKLISKGNFCWDFFERVWIRMIPLRPLAVRVYGLFRKRA